MVNFMVDVCHCDEEETIMPSGGKEAQISEVYTFICYEVKLNYGNKRFPCYSSFTVTKTAL